MADIFNRVQELNINFQGKAETFWKVLHDIGFDYKRRDGTRWLVEQPHIILKRMEFLKDMKKYLDERRNIVYQDETCLREEPVKEKTGRMITF